MKYLKLGTTYLAINEETDEIIEVRFLEKAKLIQKYSHPGQAYLLLHTHKKTEAITAREFQIKFSDALDFFKNESPFVL